MVWQWIATAWHMLSSKQRLFRYGINNRNPIRGWFFWHGLAWSNLLCIWNTGCKVWKGHCWWCYRSTWSSKYTKNDLKKVLNEHTKLFDGTLGVNPHRKFHIDLVPEAVPKHFRQYAIPVVHLEALKKELIHLVKIGYYLLKVPVNGHLQPLSHPKKMAESVGSVT